MRVQGQRAVKVDYELRNQSGLLLESTAQTGPLRSIHGNNEIAPGLEQHWGSSKLSQLSAFLSRADEHRGMEGVVIG
ncbi:MAG: hypothetical protein MK135_09265 [Polyangiaceae bacterium]|nr:hypothetical protein [Polyangiaceae bacterium]